MSNVWTGANLVDRLAQKLGFTDSTFETRCLEWINDISEDISEAFNWDFWRYKLKKQVAIGQEIVDLAPQIPSAPTAVIAVGGSLTDASVYYVKTTFLLFDESGKYENATESEPSPASAACTATAANKTINLTAIDTYDGATVTPSTIYRRIYLKKDSAAYFLYSEITNNTATTASITAETTEVIEPPEFSPVKCLSGDPFIEGSNVVLLEQNFDKIRRYDPSGSSGTPNYYSRIGKDKIAIYPKPSVAITLSYMFQRKPGRVYNDSTTKLQIPVNLKKVLEAGVTWKGFEYKDADGQESKLSNYEQLKSTEISKQPVPSCRVRDVDGDSNGREV